MLTATLQTWQVVLVLIISTIISPTVAITLLLLQEIYYPPRGVTNEGEPHILVLASYYVGLPIAIGIGLICGVTSILTGISNPAIAYLVGPFLFSVSGVIFGVIAFLRTALTRLVSNR